jgi:hypothetical protein
VESGEYEGPWREGQDHPEEIAGGRALIEEAEEAIGRAALYERAEDRGAAIRLARQHLEEESVEDALEPAVARQIEGVAVTQQRRGDRR